MAIQTKKINRLKPDKQNAPADISLLDNSIVPSIGKSKANLPSSDLLSQNLPDGYSPNLLNGVQTDTADKPVSQDIDYEIRTASLKLGVFSPEVLPDNQVEAPSCGEFIADHYRMMNIAATNIGLSLLPVHGDIPLEGFDENGRYRTCTLPLNVNINYDALYGHTTNSHVIKAIKKTYSELKLDFKKMELTDALGVGHSITSSQQAKIFLNDYGQKLISGVLQNLIHEKNVGCIEKWYTTHVITKIDDLVTNAVSKSTDDYSLMLQNDTGEKLPRHHHPLIFTKRYLGQRILTLLPNRVLNLSTLTAIFLGVDWYNPNFSSSGIDGFISALKKDKHLRQSIVNQGLLSARKVYSINDLLD